MHRLWLIFAQAVTVSLGILFVVTTLRPDWLRFNGAPVPAAQHDTSASSSVMPASYADAVARAAPSVVNIYTTKRLNVPLIPLPDDPALRQLFSQLPGFSTEKESSSLGSGVIVSSEGYVLTNFHVVDAADEIQVALTDGRTGAAKVVGADPDTDLAVLKLNLPDLPAIPFAQKEVAVGDVVLAIGNPFGVGQTTTMGIVSAVGRNGLGINTYENFIQTDAAINPGNSGGALIGADGGLVGINTAIYSESGGSLGIGFAIPSLSAHDIMTQIIETGAVQRGWLGVEPQDVTPDLTRAFDLPRDTRGIIIAGIMRDGPADKAGLRVGDIVQQVNDVQVRDTRDILGMIAALKPGEKATVHLLRSGKKLSVEVVAGKRPTRPR